MTDSPQSPMEEKRARHTPGPWKVGAPMINGGRAEQVVTESGRLVAVCKRVRNETKANSRLIAAAPDLLAALQECVANSSSEEAARKGRAAIAKAKGE